MYYSALLLLRDGCFVDRGTKSWGRPRLLGVLRGPASAAPPCSLAGFLQYLATTGPYCVSLHLFGLVGQWSATSVCGLGEGVRHLSLLKLRLVGLAGLSLGVSYVVGATPLRRRPLRWFTCAGCQAVAPWAVALGVATGWALWVPGGLPALLNLSNGGYLTAVDAEQLKRRRRVPSLGA